MYVLNVEGHNLFTMSLLYVIIGLAIQGSFTFAHVTDSEEYVDSGEIISNKTDINDNATNVNDVDVDSSEIINNNTDINDNATNVNDNVTNVNDDVTTEHHDGQKDWFDFLLLPETHLYPTSSVAMMNQATSSEKSVEEQLDEIKEIAQKITLAIQSEMANLLSYALNSSDKGKEENESEENNLRKKRSLETPMASTQLITRLLKHIKSNNEFQNIAIDKMMTAQEIADKYGIEFSPDTEILSDLAFAANQQANEMNSLLQDSISLKNVSQKVEHTSAHAPTQEKDSHVSFVQYPEQTPITLNTQPAATHYHHANSYPSYNYFYSHPQETQIPPPATYHNSPPVSKCPNFYDTVSYTPQEYSYCSIEPVTSTIIMPIEELVQSEPELVGEELEETVSSKVYVDRGDEPGSVTVNHVMTYTVGEKSYFKTPEIERLPQQVQYSFFLI